MNERFPLCEDARTDEVMLQVKNFTSADPRSFKTCPSTFIRGDTGHRRTGGGTEDRAHRSHIRPAKNCKRGTDCQWKNSGQPFTPGCHTQRLRPSDRRAQGNGNHSMLSVWDNALTVAYKKLTGNVFRIHPYEKLSPSADKGVHGSGCPHGWDKNAYQEPSREESAEGADWQMAAGKL